MLVEKTRVLLVLPRDALDRARVFAGRATTSLKLPVSLQIVLRALIGEGLKRANHPSLLANVEQQANAVRRIRSVVSRGRPAGGARGDRRPAIRHRPRGGPEPRRRRP